jgi:hypothetical protein
MALTSKPTMADTLKFAEEAGQPIGKGKETPQKSATGDSGKSGKVPAGDVRLTANISADRHLKLKIEAATRRTTIGELIEELIDSIG